MGDVSLLFRLPHRLAVKVHARIKSGADTEPLAVGYESVSGGKEYLFRVGTESYHATLVPLHTVTESQRMEGDTVYKTGNVRHCLLVHDVQDHLPRPPRAEDQERATYLHGIHGTAITHGKRVSRQDMHRACVRMKETTEPESKPVYNLKLGKYEKPQCTLLLPCDEMPIDAEPWMDCHPDNEFVVRQYTDDNDTIGDFKLDLEKEFKRGLANITAAAVVGAKQHIAILPPAPTFQPEPVIKPHIVLEEVSPPPPPPLAVAELLSPPKSVAVEQPPVPAPRSDAEILRDKITSSKQGLAAVTNPILRKRKEDQIEAWEKELVAKQGCS